jgi:hypothetical protein
LNGASAANARIAAAHSLAYEVRLLRCNTCKTLLMAELKGKIAALESQVRGHPGAMLGLARMLQEDGQRERRRSPCAAPRWRWRPTMRSLRQGKVLH